MHHLFRILRRYNYIFLFLLLEIVSILLIVQNSYYQSGSIVSKTSKISGSIMSMRDGFTDYFHLRKENEALVAENATLRQQIKDSYLISSGEEFTKNDTLYKLQYKYIVAKVISNSVNKRNNFIMLNKGSDYGVKPDMAVISPKGIVGIVTHVSDHFAVVMSVLHSDSRHSVRLTRIKSLGSLVWNGNSYKTGTLIDVPSTHKLYKGDTVVTSGFSQDFPQGIPVGYLEKISLNKGTGFYDIKMKFATDFNTLEYVYVITNIYKEEQQKLLEEISQNE